MKRRESAYGIIIAVLLVINIILFKENQLLKTQNLMMSNSFNLLADRIISLEQRIDAPRFHESDPGAGVVYTPEPKEYRDRKQKRHSPEPSPGYLKGGNRGYIIRNGLPNN